MGEPDERINVPMALDDLESLLQLCMDIRGLIHSDHLDQAVKLAAIDQAMTTAVGGTVEEARDLVRDVVLGRIEP